MAKMRAAQISKAKGPFELVERDIPEPGSGQVRIKVEACGVCHSDSVVKDGIWPNMQYPRVPGHEVIGIIDEVGPDVKLWKKGQRVGVGWHGAHCGYCNACRGGQFFGCQTGIQTTGVTYDGGYAEYMVAPAIGLAAVPEGLSPIDAAPLMCAGVTTFNALRNTDAKAGDVVAILGLGGLGHLAVQYAAKMGFNTVGIARGKDKESFAHDLGAKHYIDTLSQDPAAELQKLGGAKVILATATAANAISAVQGGLGLAGKLLIVGISDSFKVNPLNLIMGNRSVSGWYSGTSKDSQDTLEFSQLSGIHSMNEVYPLEKVAEAYDRMMSGNARFRVVLTP